MALRTIFTHVYGAKMSIFTSLKKSRTCFLVAKGASRSTATFYIWHVLPAVTWTVVPRCRHCVGTTFSPLPGSFWSDRAVTVGTPSPPPLPWRCVRSVTHVAPTCPSHTCCVLAGPLCRLWGPQWAKQGAAHPAGGQKQHGRGARWRARGGGRGWCQRRRRGPPRRGSLSVTKESPGVSGRGDLMK